MKIETEKRTSLADMTTGTQCVIVKVNGYGGLRHRLMEMGFVRGETVTVIKNAPLLDPIEYQIMDTHVSLRRSEADQIEVVYLDKLDKDINLKTEYNGIVTEEEVISNVIREKINTITVALVGNPNSGKTSFFNHATGLREKVGNYGGVTVNFKVGTFYYKGYTIRLVDLPGTYSMMEYSPEERYVREYITKSHIDMVLNIVDSSNLERNLFLTTQLIDMNVRIVMALNMFDELTAKGDTFDYKALGNMLGFPIIPTTASKGKGVNEVLQTIIDIYEGKKELTKHVHINYGKDIEESIVPIKKKIELNKNIIDIYPARYIALTTLENVKSTIDEVQKLPNGSEIIKEAKKRRHILETGYNEDVTTLLTNARYAFIRGALQETFKQSDKNKRWTAYKADNILTNKWLGFPILLLFMFITFHLTFVVGAYPQEWIEAGVAWLGELIGSWMNDGILRDLIVDGIIAGVGGVLVFLPNIVILFLFIAILEDTGYMARAAFIVDKLMHKIGLHGKSFIPFIVGFGCTVPAIMATRTLESRKDRLVTILVTPFMSCSARLPVYLLLVSAFFDKYQGLILLSIYLIGIIFAVLTALLLNKTSFKGSSEQFVMELPPYRIPTFRNVLLHMWDKSVVYLRKMGTIILAASIIIWALEYFPRDNKETRRIAQEIEMIQMEESVSEEEQEEQIKMLEMEKNAARSANSYIGRFGHLIEPLVRPCGFDWRMGVSLTTGIAAKEVVVSTMAVLFQADEEEEEDSLSLHENHSPSPFSIDNLKEGTLSLRENLKTQKWESGPKKGELLFTPLVAFGFMIFVLLSTPCIATLAAIKREAGGWKGIIFALFYNTGLAWLVSFLIYQIGMLL